MFVDFLLQPDHGLVDWSRSSEHFVVEKLCGVQFEDLYELLIEPWIKLLAVKVSIDQSKGGKVSVIECEVLRISTQGVCLKFREVKPLHVYVFTRIAFSIHGHLSGNRYQWHLEFHIVDHALDRV